MRSAGRKKGHCHPQAVGHRWDNMLGWAKNIITDFLLVIGWEVMVMLLGQILGTVTHSLLVIDKTCWDSWQKMMLSLTSCWSGWCNDTSGNKDKSVSLTSCWPMDEMDETTRQKKSHCHPLAISHRIRWDETALHRKGHFNSQAVDNDVTVWQ